ncbi:hypothetical protein JCM8208_001341 [Rhodotorula glutinis]
MDFAALKAKAEAAASSARASIPAKPAQRYEPVRPALGTTRQFPSTREQRQQSDVLQHADFSKRVLPPPPRRLTLDGAPDQASAPPPPSYSTPSATTTKARPPPPPARKPSSLAAPPPRAAKPPSFARAPLSSSTFASSPVPPVAPSSGRPIPAPPYSHAVAHDLPTAPPPPSLPARSPVASPAISRAVEPMSTWKPFSAYDERDKGDLFSALDSFFGARLDITTTSYTTEIDEDEDEPHVAEPAPYLAPSRAAAPPPIASASRPRLAPTSSSTSSSAPDRFAPTPKPPELHAPSYPPRESHSSAALSLLHYLTSHPFSSPWFVHSPSPTSSPLPPPLVGRTDLRFTASWSQRNSLKQHVGVALFADASVAWWRISWTAESERAGRAHLDAECEARYRPRPDVASWDAHALYAHSEALGGGVARFAEEAVERGEPVARGECWDLASEALGAAGAAAGGGGDKAFSSIGRTHGALLYHAAAGRDGTWTGGDAYVRAGDVVEWRSVRISEVGARRGEYMVLGDPDHTAVILSASPPLSPPSLPPSSPFVDPSYPLASLSSITVAEQSLGQAPSIRTYDLSTMTEGEVWIYRPCTLRALCGIDEIEAVWPEGRGIECWSVGELE